MFYEFNMKILLRVEVLISEGGTRYRWIDIEGRENETKRMVNIRSISIKFHARRWSSVFVGIQVAA